MDGLLREIPTSGKIFLGGDLNGHVGKDNTGCEKVHGGQGFWEKNELGDTIMAFALAFDFVIAKTYFKREMGI